MAILKIVEEQVDFAEKNGNAHVVTKFNTKNENLFKADYKQPRTFFSAEF